MLSFWSVARYLYVQTIYHTRYVFHAIIFRKFQCPIFINFSYLLAPLPIQLVFICGWDSILQVTALHDLFGKNMTSVCRNYLSYVMLKQVLRWLAISDQCLTWDLLLTHFPLDKDLALDGANQPIFWYGNDNDLNTCFGVTWLLCDQT